MATLTAVAAAVMLAAPPTEPAAPDRRAPVWLSASQGGLPSPDSAAPWLARQESDRVEAIAVVSTLPASVDGEAEGTGRIGAAPMSMRLFVIGPLLVSPRCAASAAESACRARALESLSLADAVLEARISSDRADNRADNRTDNRTWFLRDAPKQIAGDDIDWTVPSGAACAIIGPHAATEGCPAAPAADAALGARLHRLGSALLADAHRAAIDPPATEARSALRARVLEVPPLPPGDAISFAGWCKAVDGAQCLLRVAGDPRAADLWMSDLAELLKRIGAGEQAAAFRARAAASDAVVASFSEHQAFPLECWRIGEALVRAREVRRQTLAKVIAEAVRIALDAGMAPDALRELEQRLAMCEEWLPLGLEIDASGMRTMGGHLVERLTASPQAEWDVLRARETSWEAYAAMWNLSGDLPESIRRARAAQRSDAIELMQRTAFGPGVLDGAAGPTDAQLRSLGASLRELVESPFQPLLLLPATERGVERFRSEMQANSEAMSRGWGAELAAIRAEGDPAAADWMWRMFIADIRFQLASALIGELALEQASYQLQTGSAPSWTNPFAGDCSPAWINSSGDPPFASMLRRQ